LISQFKEIVQKIIHNSALICSLPTYVADMI